MTFTLTSALAFCFCLLFLPCALAQTLVVATGEGTTTLAYSTDGISFTPGSGTLFPSRGYMAAHSESHNRWVAVGFACATSGGGCGGSAVRYSNDDGVTWLVGTAPLVDGFGVAYSAALDQWVAVGDGPSTVVTSADGITWVNSANPTGFTRGLTAIYVAPDAQWVVGAVGTGTNHIATSNDGLTWTTRSSSFTNRVRKLGYSSSLSQYVAVGSGAIRIAYSGDAVTWTDATTQPFGSIGRGIGYSESLMRWVAGGGDGGGTTMVTSTDGDNWSPTTTQAFSTTGRDVVYSEPLSLYMSGGAGGNAYATSTDGLTWTTPSVPFTSVFGIGRRQPTPPPGPPSAE